MACPCGRRTSEKSESACKPAWKASRQRGAPRRRRKVVHCAHGTAQHQYRLFAALFLCAYWFSRRRSVVCETRAASDGLANLREMTTPRSPFSRLHIRYIRRNCIWTLLTRFGSSEEPDRVFIRRLQTHPPPAIPPPTRSRCFSLPQLVQAGPMATALLETRCKGANNK